VDLEDLLHQLVLVVLAVQCHHQHLVDLVVQRYLVDPEDPVDLEDHQHLADLEVLGDLYLLVDLVDLEDLRYLEDLADLLHLLVPEVLVDQCHL